MTLKVGSSQADHNGRSGLCFTLDWLPVKPHNILAAGFCDGNLFFYNNLYSIFQVIFGQIVIQTDHCPYSTLLPVLLVHDKSQKIVIYWNICVIALLLVQKRK